MTNNGGKREGAGRPPAAPTAAVRFSLTLPQHKEYLARGGARWAKRTLEAYLTEPLPAKETDEYLFGKHVDTLESILAKECKDTQHEIKK